MKKLIFTAAAFLFTASAFTFDWGGSLGNISKFEDTFSNDGLKLDQKNYAALWGASPLGTKGSFTLSGRFQREYLEETEDSINAVNLDSAKLSFRTGSLQFTLGRFDNSDLSSIVYSQSGDGAEFKFQNPGLAVSTYGFYTGLLNSQFITMNDPDYAADSEKLYDLCAKYLVAGLKVKFPSLFSEQTLSLEVFDANRLEGKAFNRLFAEAALEGPLQFSDTLFYDLTAVLQVSKYGTQNTKIAGLSKAGVYFYPGVKNSEIALKALYATGTAKDEDAKNTAFSAITSKTAVRSLEGLEYSGIFTGGLSASIKPFKNLLLSAEAEAVFSTDENKFKYSGLQYQASAGWHILSDIFAGVEFSQYFDKENSDINKTELSLKATVSF